LVSSSQSRFGVATIRFSKPDDVAPGQIGFLKRPPSMRRKRGSEFRQLPRPYSTQAAASNGYRLEIGMVSQSPKCHDRDDAHAPCSPHNNYQ